MPRYDDAPWVQLNARIPENLHRRLKVHCVETDTSQMQFLVRALREKLTRIGTHKRAGRGRS